jgi:hypothetical protein
MPESLTLAVFVPAELDVDVWVTVLVGEVLDDELLLELDVLVELDEDELLELDVDVFVQGIGVGLPDATEVDEQTLPSCGGVAALTADCALAPRAKSTAPTATNISADRLVAQRM